MSLSDPFDFFLQWHLTEKCNLRCRHCYQSGSGRSELTLREIGDAAAEAADMLTAWEELYGVEIDGSCNVTGGEPLLRPDLESVLEILAGAGFELYLLSNATLIDRRWSNTLASLGVRGVQVSMEGTEEIHDGLRGAGSYRAALEGAENLVAAGLTVTFNMTLSRLNAYCLEPLIALAGEMGVARVGFSRLVSAGRGAELRDRMLDAREVEDLYRRIFSMPDPPVQIVTGDPLVGRLDKPPSPPDESAPMGGCAAGVSGLTLLPDGTILPCRRLEVPIGNIRKDSLREVWATSPVLQNLRNQNLYRGACRTCSRWSVCRGCRAIAWSCSDDTGPAGYLAEDPQCPQAEQSTPA